MKVKFALMRDTAKEPKVAYDDNDYAYDVYADLNMMSLFRLNSKQQNLNIGEIEGGYLGFREYDQIILTPRKRLVVPTGLKVELPETSEIELYGQNFRLKWSLKVLPRSGLAANYGITVLNSPGIVDAGYRGEIGVILVNLSDEDFVIKQEMRIAQVTVESTLVPQFEFVQVEHLTETKRSEGGMGSSGLGGKDV